MKDKTGRALAESLAEAVNGADPDAALGRAGERCVRLWALDVLAGRGLLTAGELEARAMKDPDPVVALWCARQLAAPSGQLPAGAGPRLIGSSRAAVRAFAAGHLADDLLPREVLRELLADRSGPVRSVARWRWTRIQGRTEWCFRRAVLSGCTRRSGSPPAPCRVALT